ncbi:MAG: hypothetical protein NZT92_03810 [Abditibacteriales bacterium]|nr:hypothetical protein [Abditibacteriales bacterium]MDW8365092.1 hypothetical protein [Abditibacteriales bacterium]
MVNDFWWLVVVSDPTKTPDQFSDYYSNPKASGQAINPAPSLTGQLDRTAANK